MTANGKKIHRFLCAFSQADDLVTVDDSSVAHQVGTVLGLKPGETIGLSDGANELTAEILEVGRGQLRLRVREVRPAIRPRRAVRLCLAILKRDNFELAARMATEVGVTEIFPLVSQRTVKLDFRRDRLERILQEAAEQCGRGAAPQLADPANLSEALAAIPSGWRKVMFDVGGGAWSASNLVGNEPVAIFVGPEGGWTETERQQALEAGAEVVSLGAMVMRGETAATVAAWLAVNAQEE